MTTPQLTPEQVVQVSGLVAEFIAAQRQWFSPQAVPLAAAQRAAMDGFLPPQVLDAARVLVLRGVRVENPLLYRSIGNRADNCGIVFPAEQF